MCKYIICDIFCQAAKKYFFKCPECPQFPFLVCYNYTGDSGGWTLSHRQKEPPLCLGRPFLSALVTSGAGDKSIEAHFVANAVMLFKFVISAKGNGVDLASIVVGDAAAMERREAVVKRAEEIMLSVIR